MATFTPDPGLGVGANMFLFFGFAPGGGYTIDDIVIVPFSGDDVAVVTDEGAGGLGGDFRIDYVGPDVSEGADTNLPVSGSFTSIKVFDGATTVGIITGIGPGLGNFGEIDLLQAYNVLLGNDIITGTAFGDTLFTGDGGRDEVDGLGGDDSIFMAAAAGAPAHVINGGAGTDTLAAISNVFFSADKVLDLRNASVLNIENLLIEGGVTVRLLGSQIGAGLVSSAAGVSNNFGFGSGNVTLEVVLGAPGAVNLSGFNVGAGVSIIVFGSAGADTISGTGIGETIRGDAGADTVNGNGGNDLFLVAGTTAEFDAMNGGGGTDTLELEGNTPVTLNGFSAAGSSIEALAAFGLGIAGNAGNNAFDLSGLGSVTGLAFVDGGAGDDTIVGSGFADILRGGLGRDTLTGGGAADFFDFNAVAEIGKKGGFRDLIGDFAQGSDLIDLSTIDANGAKKGDQAFKLLKGNGAEFTDKAGQLHWYKVNKPGTANDLTRVEGDTDGNGKADFKLELAGLVKLAAADFVL